VRFPAFVHHHGRRHRQREYAGGIKAGDLRRWLAWVVNGQIPYAIVTDAFNRGYIGVFQGNLRQYGMTFVSLHWICRWRVGLD
jgi:hypothetical protein